jgi:hypothetical protein
MSTPNSIVGEQKSAAKSPLLKRSARCCLNSVGIWPVCASPSIPLS